MNNEIPARQAGDVIDGVTLKDSPAKFSVEVLDVLEGELVAYALDEQRVRAGEAVEVLDPFAGTGRVHRLAMDEPKIATVGLELEPEWALWHPRTHMGDTLRVVERFGPDAFDAIVTSVVYPNRMTDHHDARDDSKRYTYTHYIGRKLTPNNAGVMGWGDVWRAFHRTVFERLLEVARPDSLWCVNISNHVTDKGETEHRVSEWALVTLLGLGLRLQAVHPVITRRSRNGANREYRTDREFVIVLRSPRAKGML